MQGEGERGQGWKNQDWASLKVEANAQILQRTFDLNVNHVSVGP